MYPMIPADMFAHAVQWAIYLVTAVAVWLSFTMTARA